MRKHQHLHYIIGFILLALGIGSAQASPVYQDFQMVFGDTQTSTPIAIAQAGTYEATLVDFGFPAPFDVLALAITTSQPLQLLGAGIGTGTFTFNLPAPGTILANLVAWPGQIGVGTYGVEITAIPLPPAFALFASALIGLTLIARRKNVDGSGGR